jgi:hypothetical protein
LIFGVLQPSGALQLHFHKSVNNVFLEHAATVVEPISVIVFALPTVHRHVRIKHFWCYPASIRLLQIIRPTGLPIYKSYRISQGIGQRVRLMYSR